MHTKAKRKPSGGYIALPLAMLAGSIPVSVQLYKGLRGV